MEAIREAERRYHDASHPSSLARVDHEHRIVRMEQILAELASMGKKDRKTVEPGDSADRYSS